MSNRGKKFEVQTKEDFELIEGSTINRLYDTVNYFKGVKNVCDFIGYIYPFIFYIECKTKQGNTFPIDSLRSYNTTKNKYADVSQYTLLCEKIGIKGVMAGVLIWFVDHDKVLWCDIEGIRNRVEEGIKSINIKDVGKYNTYEIPITIKRVYPKMELGVLVDLAKEKFKE